MRKSPIGNTNILNRQSVLDGDKRSFVFDNLILYT